MSLGYFEQQEINAPGAWDHLDHGQPAVLPAGRQNAAHKPYDKALSVQERTAAQAIFSYVEIDAAGDPIQVVGRQIGRKFVILKCPTAMTSGVYISHRGEEITLYNSYYLAPGDPPLYLPTEASIWAGTGALGVASALSVVVGVATDSDQDQ